MRTMHDRIKELRILRAKLYECGGTEKVQKRHDEGKLTARERIALIADPHSFQEMNLFAKHSSIDFGMKDKDVPAEGVVTGSCLIDGRPVFLVSQDFTSLAGTVGEMGARKICEAMDNALNSGLPFIFINDSGGARIQEGVSALSGYGRIFHKNVKMSGVIPQISIIAGPCAGGAAYSPALTDFIIQIRDQGQMYITGPKIIKEVTGEDVTAEDLGGCESHAVHSGVVHFEAESDEDAMNIARRLLSFLPSNNKQNPPLIKENRQEMIGPDEILNTIVPDNSRVPYDMKNIIFRVVDNSDFMEIQESYAPNIIVGLGRINGRTVGIVASQPMYKAGVLDINSSDKSSSFIRFCDAFNIPIVNFVDVPGFLPGLDQEQGGIIRHGAKMLFAYADATVPKITIIVRKAYGGAYLAMCSREMGADRVAAWPSAEIAVMGAEGAVKLLYSRQLASSKNKDEEYANLVEKYRNEVTTPYNAAGKGYVHNVIIPADTRSYISLSLELLANKSEKRPEKKHGLIPL